MDVEYFESQRAESFLFFWKWSSFWYCYEKHQISTGLLYITFLNDKINSLTSFLWFLLILFMLWFLFLYPFKIRDSLSLTVIAGTANSDQKTNRCPKMTTKTQKSLGIQTRSSVFTIWKIVTSVEQSCADPRYTNVIISGLSPGPYLTDLNPTGTWSLQRLIPWFFIYTLRLYIKAGRLLLVDGANTALREYNAFRGGYEGRKLVIHDLQLPALGRSVGWAVCIASFFLSSFQLEEMQI